LTNWVAGAGKSDPAGFAARLSPETLCLRELSTKISDAKR